MLGALAGLLEDHLRLLVRVVAADGALLRQQLGTPLDLVRLLTHVPVLPLTTAGRLPDDAGPDGLTVWLQNTDTAKPAKNRGHLDLRPTDGDVEAEVDRLLALGARHVDVGQRADDPFVVLADPEGNKFCVLRREPRGR